MEGISEVGADNRRWEPVSLDAEELARAIRGLAVEAHELLNRREATTGELIALRRRAWELLRGVRGSQTAELERWLRSVHRTLGAKLLSRRGGGPRRWLRDAPRSTPGAARPRPMCGPTGTHSTASRQADAASQNAGLQGSANISRTR